MASPISGSPPTARSSLLGDSQKGVAAGSQGSTQRQQKKWIASTPTFERLFSGSRSRGGSHGSSVGSRDSPASAVSRGSSATSGYGSSSEAGAVVATPSTAYSSAESDDIGGRSSPSLFASDELGYSPLITGHASVHPQRLGAGLPEADQDVVVTVDRDGTSSSSVPYQRALLGDFQATEPTESVSSRRLAGYAVGDEDGSSGDGPGRDGGGESQREDKDKDPRFHPDAPATKSVIMCVIPLFMGYACLFSLQHKITGVYGIPDQGALFDEFGNAVSFLYIGNLVFRFAHNIVFACITPRARVAIAITSMMTSLSLLLFGVFIFRQTQTLAWVYGAYGLGGVAVGSFEANVLSAITPLGHQTKLWATLGIPIGVSSITIGAFGIMAAGVPPEVIYGVTIGALLCSLFVWSCVVPYHHVKGNSDSVSAFWGSLKDFPLWLPKIKWHAVCLAIDMACVSTFSPGVMLYVFDAKDGVPLFGAGGVRVNHNAFFCVYNLCTFFGETISRKLAYVDKKERSPFLFLLFSLAGVGLNVAGALFSFGIICPIAGLFVFLANGSIYNRTTKFVDNHIDPIFNLTALSAWLFVGDLGSVLGSNMTPYVRQWLG